MIKSNKVTNKILLPKILSLFLILGLTSSSIIYITQEKTSTTNRIDKYDALLTFLALLLVIFYCIDIHADYRKGEKFSKLIAIRYLKQEIKKHPELKLFEKVLDNPQALQNMSALILNSLRPSEQKLVAKIILNACGNLRNNKKYNSDEAESLKNARAIISDACNQTVSVLQEHAAIHPEFIREIYSAMAREDMIYIMSKNPIQQHTK